MTRTLWITAKCGHEVEFTPEYKEKDWRTQKAIERIESALCDACQIAAYAQQLGVELPELQGSERQVAWASDLRLQFLNLVMPQVVDEISRQVVARLAVRPEARVWIDERPRFQEVFFIERDRAANEAEARRVQAEVAAEIEAAQHPTTIVEETSADEPVFNVGPLGTLFGSVTPDMPAVIREHAWSTQLWMIQQTSDAELAAYGETREYLKDHVGIGTTIAIVARLALDGSVHYHCDRDGSGACEHTRMVEDAIARRRAQVASR